ncbi:hypothetical protein B7L63_28145 [Escherichia coli]|nr:hypothetical protein B7L63_28145 [Escherichia coli]
MLGSPALQPPAPFALRASGCRVAKSFIVFCTDGQNHLNVQVVRELNKGRKKGRLRSLIVAFSADRAEPTR